MKRLLITALCSVALAGCSGEAEDGHGHSHGGGGTVDVPDHYGAAVAACEKLSGQITLLIDNGKLDDVHAAAADIKKIAEKLADLAKSDLPPGALKDVNVNARKLAGMFSVIDEAADAGKKDETVRLHNEMKALIAALKKHAKEGEHDDHDEQDDKKEHDDH